MEAPSTTSPFSSPIDCATLDQMYLRFRQLMDDLLRSLQRDHQHQQLSAQTVLRSQRGSGVGGGVDIEFLISRLIGTNEHYKLSSAIVGVEAGADAIVPIQSLLLVKRQVCFTVSATP